MRVADAIARTPKWMAVPGMLIAVAVAMQNPACAGEPSTSVQTEYLMTLHAPLAPPLAVDQSLLVIGASGPGGWVEGPRIKGKLVGSAGDWLRVMPSGVLRQDVRGTIQTDTNDHPVQQGANGSIERWRRIEDRRLLFHYCADFRDQV